MSWMQEYMLLQFLLICFLIYFFPAFNTTNESVIEIISIIILLKTKHFLLYIKMKGGERGGGGGRSVLVLFKLSPNPLNKRS